MRRGETVAGERDREDTRARRRRRRLRRRRAARAGDGGARVRDGARGVVGVRERDAGRTRGVAGDVDDWARRERGVFGAVSGVGGVRTGGAVRGGRGEARGRANGGASGTRGERVRLSRVVSRLRPGGGAYMLRGDGGVRGGVENGSDRTRGAVGAGSARQV